MKKDKIFYGWYIVAGATLLLAVVPPGVVSLASLYQGLVVSDFGITEGAFALNSALLQGVGIFLAPLASRLLSTDKFKKVLIIALTVFGLGYMGYGLAQNVLQLYIISLILGVAFTFGTMLPVALMISNWFVHKRGLAISIAMTGIGIGGFLFSPLVTNLLATYSWRITYMIYGALMLAVALPLSLFVFKRTPQDMGLQPLGVEEEIASDIEKNPAKVAQFKAGVTQPLGQIMKKPFFIMFLLGIMLNGLINGGTIGQYPAAINVVQQNPGITATAIMTYSFIGIGGKLLVGRLNDKYGMVSTTILTYSAMIASLLFMLNGQHMWAIYGAAITYGFALPSGSVTPPLVTSAIFADQNYGRAYGYASSATQLGMTLGSLTVASIFSATGSYSNAWIMLIILTLITLASMLGAYYNSRKYID